MGIALSGRLQAGLRFLRHPLPPGPSPFLAVGLPLEGGGRGVYQLIGMEMRHGEVGPYSPVRHPGVAAGKASSGGPSHTALRRQRPVSLFGRFGVTSPEAGLHVLPRPAVRLAGRSALSPKLHTLDCSAACPGRGTSTPEGPAGEGTPPPALRSQPYDPSPVCVLKLEKVPGRTRFPPPVAPPGTFSPPL